MPRSNNHLLVRQLSNIGNLSDAERDAIQNLDMQVVDLPADHEISREGDRPGQCCLILQGFVINFKITPEGNRQILAYHLAGDIPDLLSLHLHTLDSAYATITPCKVGFIPHSTMEDLCTQHPQIGKILWRWTLITGSIYREWVVSIGQRTATQRLAHLFCEIMTRMKAMGFAQGQTCEMPMTQAELADATGMSTVHLNRSLQELRANQFLELKGTVLTVLDWPGLTKCGQFDPSYLHLKDPH